MAECTPCDASGSMMGFGLVGQAAPRSVEARLAALEARPVPYPIEYGLSLPLPSAYSAPVMYADMSEPALYVWREIAGEPVWQRLVPSVAAPVPTDLSGYLTAAQAALRYAAVSDMETVRGQVEGLSARFSDVESGCVTRDALAAMDFVDSSALAAALADVATESQVRTVVSDALASYSRVTPEELSATVAGLLAAPSVAAASMAAGLGGSESDPGLVSAAQTLLSLLDAFGVVRRTGGNAELPAPGDVGSLSADALLARYAPVSSLSGLVTRASLSAALSGYATLASLQDVVRYHGGSDSDGEGNAYWNLLCGRRYADTKFATKDELASVAATSASAETVRLMSTALGDIGGRQTVGRRLDLLEARASGDTSGGLALISDGEGSAARLSAVMGTAIDTEGGKWQLVLQDGFRLVPVQRAVQADPDAVGSGPAPEGSGCLWDVAAAACYPAMRDFVVTNMYSSDPPGSIEFWREFPFLVGGTSRMEFPVLPWHVLIPEPGVAPYRDGWLEPESDSDGGSSGSDFGVTPRHARRFSLSLPYAGSPSSSNGGPVYCRLGGELKGSVETGPDETYSYSVPLTGSEAPVEAYVISVGFTVDPRQVTESGRAEGPPVRIIPGRGVRTVNDWSLAGRCVVAGGAIHSGQSDGLTEEFRLAVIDTSSWRSSASMTAGVVWPWVTVDFTEVAPDTFLVTADVGETAADPSRAFVRNACDSYGNPYGGSA